VLRKIVSHATLAIGLPALYYSIQVLAVTRSGKSIKMKEEASHDISHIQRLILTMKCGSSESLTEAAWTCGMSDDGRTADTPRSFASSNKSPNN